MGLGETEITELCNQGACDLINTAFAEGLLIPGSLARTALNLFRRFTEKGTKSQRAATLLAVLYTVSDAELSKLSFWPLHFDETILNAEILRSVPKERLQFFAERLIDFNSSNHHFEEVKALYQSGLIEKPRTNSYVAGLIRKCTWANKDQAGLTKTLTSEPEFLTDEVWLLFKFSGTADNCLASADKFLTVSTESWESVLISLSEQGVPDRERLLDESLIALTRDFNQFRAGWFSRFHEAMKPTSEEQFQRLETYARLLASPIPATVSFALRMLGSSDKSNSIKFAQLASYIPTALSAKSKQTALGAIKLLQSCAEREQSERPAICLLVCSALISEASDVQTAVLRLISMFGNENDLELQDCINSYLPGLAASVRKKLPEFMRNRGTTIEEQSNSACENTEGTDKVTEPRLSVRAENTRNSDEGSQMVATVGQASQLKPIDDLSDLIIKAAFVLENEQSECEYELVLDGILRNCGTRADDFAERTSALLQHAHKKWKRSNGVATGILSRMIITWITGDTIKDTINTFSETTFRRLHWQRINALIDRVKARETSALLSLPTDRFGWIEPNELRKRLATGNLNYDVWDRFFALMRVRNSDDELIDTITANHAHPVLNFASHLTKSPEYEWSIVTTVNELVVPRLFTSTFTELIPQLSATLPEEIIGGDYRENGKRWPAALDRSPGQEILLAGILMPKLQQMHYATGAKWLGARLNYCDVEDKAARYYLESLHDPSSMPGEMGSLLLALSISTEDHDLSVAGIDAFITLIEQQRFKFESTATAMRKLFQHESGIKANRWKVNLAKVAKSSNAHSLVVFRLFESILSPPLLVAPKDLHHILDLMVELQAQLEMPLRQETASCLEGIEMGGKTKKLIGQLVRAVPVGAA